MKLLFYWVMRLLCWKIENIHDWFVENHTLFYISAKWEDLYIEEYNRKKREK